MAHLNDADLERLSSDLDAFNRANVAAQSGSLATLDADIRAFNVLFDTCLDLGMSLNDEPAEWAAERVTRWLVEA